MSAFYYDFIYILQKKINYGSPPNNSLFFQCKNVLHMFFCRKIINLAPKLTMDQIISCFELLKPKFYKVLPTTGTSYSFTIKTFLLLLFKGRNHLFFDGRFPSRRNFDVKTLVY